MILHTEITGEGEPLVFLHTGLQTGRTDFVQQREYFSRQYQVIVPDLRGHGKSPAQDLDDYYDRAADDLVETIESMGFISVHLAGCSFGALISLFVAHKHPQLINSLTVSGVVPFKPDHWKELNDEESKFRMNLLVDKETFAYFDSIHGEGWERFIYMRQGAAGFRNSYGTIHVAVLPFASHLVHLEQPELYNKTLDLFLSNLTSS